MRWISLFSLVSCMSCSHSESTAHVSLPKPGYEIVENKDGLPFHTGLKKKPAELKGLGELHVHLAEADCANLPETYDLRPTGVVSPVRDQEQCGSC